MPQIKVWKHPRKKAYTENKYIHLRQIKVDALKNYSKKRVSQIATKLQEHAKTHGPFTTLLQYLKFVNTHHSLLEKLEALKYGEHINSRISMSLGLALLLNITEIRMAYDDNNKLIDIRLITQDYTRYRSRGLSTLYSNHKQIFGTSFQAIPLGSWFQFPYCSDFRFEDVVALGKNDRMAQEAEVIVDRLDGQNIIHLPKHLGISGDALYEFRCKLIDELFEDREITYDTIGKKVILLKEDCVYAVTLLSFSVDTVYVSLRGLALPVPRDLVKNIMGHN